VATPEVVTPEVVIPLVEPEPLPRNDNDGVESEAEDGECWDDKWFASSDMDDQQLAAVCLTLTKH
jgi:hypothetical protein